MAVVEKAVTAAALLLYSGGPINVILSGGYSQGDQAIAEPDYTLTSLIFRLTYLLFAGLLFARWKKTIRAIPAGFAVFPIIGLAILSYLWSSFPGETLSGSITLIATSLFGLYIATRYTLKEQLTILGWAFGLIVVLSFTYGIVLPKYGVMGGVHAGTWRGIYTHKNTLGKMMTLSGAVFTLLVLKSREGRLIPSIFLGLSVLLILLTTSVGALVNLGMMLSIIFLCQVVRAQYRWLVVLAGSLGLIISSALVTVALNFETIVVDILGKDPTLTGRTLIWISAWDLIQSQPWLGYGYEAFWHGMDGPSAYIWRDVMWPVPDAHNGYVELILHLGFIGFTLFFLGYFLSLGRSILIVRNTTEVQHIWPLVYLAYVFLANIPEQTLLESNTIFWVLYVSTTITLFLPDAVEEDSAPEPTYSRSIEDVKHGPSIQAVQAAQAARRGRLAKAPRARRRLEANRSNI